MGLFGIGKKKLTERQLDAAQYIYEAIVDEVAKKGTGVLKHDFFDNRKTNNPSMILIKSLTGNTLVQIDIDLSKKNKEICFGQMTGGSFKNDFFKIEELDGFLDVIRKWIQSR